jgi:hypothetical protein
MALLMTQHLSGNPVREGISNKVFIREGGLDEKGYIPYWNCLAQRIRESLRDGISWDY